MGEEIREEIEVGEYVRTKDGYIGKLIEINTKDALPKILNQMYRPSDPEAMEKTLYIIDKILSTVPVYHLYCNISDDAVVTSYEAMSGKEI